MTIVNKRFYKIQPKSEKSGFQRLSVTKLGYLDPSIEQIHAFKSDNEKYLRILFNKDPDLALVSELDRRLSHLVDYTVEDRNEELDELFVSCLPRKEGKTYILYFDRPTYTRIES